MSWKRLMGAGGRRAAPFALLALAIAVVLVALNRHGELVLQFEMESTGADGQVVLYFNDGSGFHEGATVSRPLRKGLQHYEFRLPVSRIAGFRIDPSMNDEATLIRGLEARSGSSVVRRFDASQIVPANDIVESQPIEEGRALRFRVRPGGGDPYFLVHDSALDVPSLSASRLAAMLLVALLVTAAAGFVWRLGPATGPPAPAPVLAALGIALGLVLALAILATTARSVSPDEFSHVEAARYYLDRWLPAKVGDPATLASYSAYGASYLNEMDVVYLLAAKFAAALAFTGLDDVLRLRLFNVALLALCGLLALRSRVGRIAVLPLLCTPQAWYVFGYFNADALGLVAATLLATAVVTWLDRSAEHPTLLQEAGARWAVALGILLALCLLSKRTFYPFVPFVAAYALWRLGYRTRSTFVLGALGLFTLAAWFYARPPFESVPGLIASGGARAALAALAAFLLIAAGWMTYRDYDPRRRFPKALLVAAAVAIALVVLRVGADMVVNGLPGEKARALSALAERIARPDFRPAVLGTQASYFGMALAGRGVPLGEMLFGQYAWVSTMAASFFGVYGYMSIVAVSALYWTQYAFAAVLLAAIAWACVPDRVSRGVLVLGAVAIVLTLELALGHSWVIDLQPQGRYAFAILPVVSLLLLEAQRRRDAGAAGSALMAAHGAIVALWLLALASFAFIALPNVTRIA